MKKRHEKALDYDPKGRGYVRLWRGFQEDPLYKKRRKFSQWEAWEFLYMNARGTNTPHDKPLIFRGHILRPKRGQLVTSQKELTRRWGWTRGSVENFLRKLARRGSITVETIKGAGGYSLITLRHYDELNPVEDSILSIGQQGSPK